MDGTIRVKTAVWFVTAVVLSVFATLLVSQQWRADAAPGDEDSTYVPIANCRLFDFRSGTNNVGPKNTPLGAGESNVYTQSVHGTNGDCTIPSDAVGVAMNVTIVNPTAQSNLRVFPADIATPTASNLNWLPGQSPTPNKVDVKLSPSGEIKLYNHAGSVNVLADVVGYYTNSTLTEIAERLADLERAQPFAVTARDTVEGVGLLAEIVVSVEVTAPVDGQVTVNSTTNATSSVGGQKIQCSIRVVGFIVANDGDHLQVWESAGGTGDSSQLAGTRVFDIAAGTTVRYSLVCSRTGTTGNPKMNNSILTAIFTPAP
jgi:hypothetical protein